MKLFSLTSLLVASLALSVAQAQPAAQAPPSTIQEQTSYVIGLNIGGDLKQQGIDINVNMLARGIADALGGKKPALSDQQIKAAFAELLPIFLTSEVTFHSVGHKGAEGRPGTGQHADVRYGRRAGHSSGGHRRTGSDRSAQAAHRATRQTARQAALR